MSTIDPNSTATLNKILEKIGVKSNDETSSLKKKDTLGQSDFLKLMTTQLQNQDPFSPMENGDFIAQMAQFSTVTGIAEMGESLKSLSNQLGEFRIATATNLLGHSVLVPGNKVRPNSEGEIHGVLDLPRASSATNVVFSNSAVAPSIFISIISALMPIIVSIQDASAVATKSVGEKASPFPLLSIGASVIILFPDLIWIASVLRAPLYTTLDVIFFI